MRCCCCLPTSSKVVLSRWWNLIENDSYSFRQVPPGGASMSDDNRHNPNNNCLVYALFCIDISTLFHPKNDSHTFLALSPFFEKFTDSSLLASMGTKNLHLSVLLLLFFTHRWPRFFNSIQKIFHCNDIIGLEHFTAKILKRARQKVVVK